MKVLLWPVALVIAGATFVSWRVGGGRPRVLRGGLSPALLRMVVTVLVFCGAGRIVEAEPADLPAPPTDGERPVSGVPVQVTVQGKAVEDKFEVGRSKDFPAKLDEPAAKTWVGTHPRRVMAGNQIGEVQTRVMWSLSTLQKVDLEHDRQDSSYAAAVAAVVADPVVPDTLKAVVRAGAKDAPADAKEARSLAGLTRAAEDAAKAGLYGQTLVAYLWSLTPEAVPAADAEKLATLYAKLEDVARADNALRTAYAQVRDVKFTAWRSKSGRPVVEGETYKPDELVKVAAKLFPQADAGTWDRDAVLTLKLTDKTVTYALYRRGRKVAVKAGDTVRLRRLDVLVTAPNGDAPVKATVRMAGEVTLPPVFTARNAYASLTVAARDSVRQLVTAAAEKGDPQVLKEVEAVLPAAAPLIREAFKTYGNGKGLSALKLLLTLHDE